MLPKTGGTYVSILDETTVRALGTYDFRWNNLAMQKTCKEMHYLNSHGLINFMSTFLAFFYRNFGQSAVIYRSLWVVCYSTAYVRIEQISSPIYFASACLLQKKNPDGNRGRRNRFASNQHTSIWARQNRGSLKQNTTQKLISVFIHFNRLLACF